MFENSGADLRRFLRRQPTWSAATFLFVLRSRGLQAVWVYRFGQALLRQRKSFVLWPLLAPGWLLYGALAWYVRAGYGIRLRLSAQIGPGLYIGHFGGIDVRNCRIGSNCSINQQTRIGDETDLSGPQIEDRVWIGAHTRVSGPIRIGVGATISAGSHIVRDVPAGGLMMGNPARLIAREYDNSGIL